MNGMRRRARPLLGTLVELGVPATPDADTRLDAAFGAIAALQAALSRFDARSDIARFNALPAGASLAPGEDAVRVLAAAQQLHDASEGLFDISLGSAPRGWRCDGACLHKPDAATRLDLGGIAKGYAVDRAVEVLQALGCTAGWVNAGGDLRVFGALELPIALRDEARGGVRHFGTLADGAVASSRYAEDSRSQASAPWPVRAHVSVAAPLALWADALVKIVAVSGDPCHPLLARHGAQAWLH